MIEPLLNLAYSKALFEPNSISERDAFEAKIMDAVMPSPQKVKKEFSNLFKRKPELATHYFFELSKNVNYIKSIRLKENKLLQLSLEMMLMKHQASSYQT